MKKCLFIIAIFNLCLFSCKKNVTPKNDFFANYSIVSGQSFGFCIGKCINFVEFRADSTILTSIENNRGTNNSQITEFKEKSENLDEIAQEINLDQILALKDIYGCPDCADGGAETIEVKKNGEIIKSIKFEYGKSIPEIASLIEVLRTRRVSLIKKYVDI